MISGNGGGTGNTMQVTMSTTTDGATIFYTESSSTPDAPTHTGSTPTGTTQVYSGPINVPYPQTQNFKAIAYKAGLADSVETQFTADNSGLGQSPTSGSTGSSATVFSVWDGDWELIEEYGPENQLLEKYLQDAHGVIKTFINIAYYYQDSLGSTSHIADSTGHLLESYRYDMYGKPTYFDSTSQPINASAYNAVDLFAGERWIPELGLYDDRNRFMSPELGRFLQPDPIGFKGDASNLYRYCGNDWANKTDPMGLDVTPDSPGFTIKLRDSQADAMGIEKFKQMRITIALMTMTAQQQEPSKVDYRETGNNNISQPHVYSDNGTDLPAKTYASITVTGEQNKDGSLKVLRVDDKIDVKYATAAGPKTQAFAKAREPAHERDLRAWSRDDGRDIAQNIANKYRTNAQEAVNRAQAKLSKEQSIQAQQSHLYHDFKPPIGIGDHISPYRYDE